MADRYTKKDAQAAFERLARALGKSTVTYIRHDDGTWEPINGAWKLDDARGYGGVTVMEMVGKGEGYALGARRWSYREFVEMVGFTIGALDIYAKSTGQPSIYERIDVK